MRASIMFAAAAAMASASASVLVERQRDCQALYNTCISSGRAEVACQCDLATCSGEDNARTREYCATATASLSTAPSTTAHSGALPAPSSTVVAADGSLKLGENCAETKQCAGGAECFASNFMQIKQCGKFNAACKTDSQCATNTCNNGLCNGFIATSSSASSTTTAPANSGALPAPSSTVVAADGSLKLGENCAETKQCAGGAECFASNFMQIKQCGKFNAACKTDSQCATNTCNNGLCNGFIATTSSSASSTSASATAAAATPKIDAAAGSLKLGDKCDATVQCAGGAQCYGTTAGTIKTCGSFNAACSSNAQCATNTCQNGICSGFLPEASYLAKPSTAMTTATATGKTNGTMTTGVRTPTSSVVRFTGAASKEQVGAGVVMVAGLFALAL
ncbi:hypothetical protein B9Z65_11 [Elsinoe australis]|uniref:Uncharacterized protein n=1 Tax=Elsinoe australis TaxID=40998 RepID=A0A2P7YWI5_9PEZI|nr:hypothetical protein B9Z65_11 [Elsinoe australis]